MKVSFDRVDWDNHTPKFTSGGNKGTYIFEEMGDLPPEEALGKTCSLALALAEQTGQLNNVIGMNVTPAEGADVQYWFTESAAQVMNPEKAVEHAQKLGANGIAEFVKGAKEACAFVYVEEPNGYQSPKGVAAIPVGPKDRVIGKGSGWTYVREGKFLVSPGLY
jgi:hypothetical protein